MKKTRGMIDGVVKDLVKWESRAAARNINEREEGMIRKGKRPMVYKLLASLSGTSNTITRH